MAQQFKQMPNFKSRQVKRIKNLRKKDKKRLS